MTRITAAEARNLSGPTIEERVDVVHQMIREAAMQKQRQVVLRDDFWTHGGYTPTAEYKEAVKILEADGYEVKFFYEERQFVDMYTVVKW